MMEDWTDIIGEELENIEEPLPADDWSVLQQKYAAARRRKKAAAFAWAGGITSVAAAIALVLLLVRPDSSSVIPGSTGGHNDLVAETLPPIEEVVPVDSSHVESPIDTVLYVAPSMQKKVSVPVDIVKKPVDNVLVTENNTEEITTENTEEVFDVIRDTTSLKDKLLADASITPQNDPKEEEYTQATGSFGFDDFPDDEPGRKKRPISIGLSRATSDSPIMREHDMVIPSYDALEPPGNEMEPPYNEGDHPTDSLGTGTSQAAKSIKRGMNEYSDSYNHELPISVGLSARIHLTDKLSINTGLNYTRYTSTRTRKILSTSSRQTDKQYVHYLGIPVRLDWIAADKKYYNIYLGAGMQMDKCVYAKVGNERLHEKQLLFGLNGTMGLQVNIVPKVGLYFEPEVYYALNEGTIETFRYDEAFVITVRGGLRFKF